MDYSKFYTPPSIAFQLVNELNIPSPNKIIDICCGSCNLLSAAKKRWNKAHLYGVDINEHIVESIKFKQMDGREFALEHMGEFPLVVANPPFDYVEENMQFPQLFSGPFKDFKTSRLEIEMLIANLLLLKENGVLLIILPSSFVEAERFLKVRKIVAEKFQIESIIQLDDATFGSSLIRSYVLIIKNCEPMNGAVTKIGSAPCNKLNNSIVFKDIISYEKMRSGNWIGYEDICIDNLSINIKRGNISSAYFVKRGTSILHTAKFSDNWLPSKRYISKKAKPSVYAEKGDILISRIGKSAGQWCVYDGEKMPISDCLYCIKDADGSVFETINGKTYNLPQKGVATRYITMSDFIYWINTCKQN